MVTNECWHVLSGSFKDHLCAGLTRLKIPLLSQMLAGIRTAITGIVDKNIRSTCRSTEEVCHTIEEANKMTDIKNLTEIMILTKMFLIMIMNRMIMILTMMTRIMIIFRIMIISVRISQSLVRIMIILVRIMIILVQMMT